MHGEIAATRDGKILGLRVNVLADHGAFNGAAQPTKFPAGFFHIFTGLLRLRAAHCEVTGVYTTRRRAAWPTPARSGSPRRCTWSSGWSTCLAARAGHRSGRAADEEPAAARAVPLHLRRPGGSTTPATTRARCRTAMDIAGYAELRREQAEKREPRGESWASGVSFFTEGVGAGPRKHMDILGLGMADGAELRVHPTGKAVLRVSRARPRGRGTRPRSPRSSPRNWGPRYRCQSCWRRRGRGGRRR